MTRTLSHKNLWKYYRKKTRDCTKAGYTIFVIGLDNLHGKALKYMPDAATKIRRRLQD